MADADFLVFCALVLFAIALLTSLVRFECQCPDCRSKRAADEAEQRRLKRDYDMKHGFSARFVNCPQCGKDHHEQ